jgi:hypothetical protein
MEQQQHQEVRRNRKGVLQVQDGSEIRALVENKAEFARFVDDSFRKLDADGDGRLSVKELQPAVADIGAAIGLPAKGSSPQADHIYAEVRTLIHLYENTVILASRKLHSTSVHIYEVKMVKRATRSGPGEVRPVLDPARLTRLENRVVPSRPLDSFFCPNLVHSGLKWAGPAHLINKEKADRKTG